MYTCTYRYKFQNRETYIYIHKYETYTQICIILDLLIVINSYYDDVILL